MKTLDEIASDYMHRQEMVYRAGGALPSKAKIRADLKAEAQAYGLDVATIWFAIKLAILVARIWKYLRRRR